MGSIRFENRVVVVTGAGQGLGRAYALEFARRGAAVLVNDIGSAVDGRGELSDRVASAVVEEIRAAGGRAEANFDSVSSHEGARRIIEAAQDHFGGVDVVVTNAGTIRFTPFHETPSEDFQLMLDVHLGGNFYVAQAAYRVMQRRNYGRFVLVSSNSGFLGLETQAAYGAAKAGVMGLNNQISLEGAKYGIRSNALMPVAVTRMAGVRKAEDGGESRSELERLLPVIGQRLTPDHVVPLVVYLGSEQCQQTGQMFSAVGGRYVRAVRGIPRGWAASDPAPPSVEDLAAHWDEVVSTAGLREPRTGIEEIAFVAEQLAATAR